MISLETPQRKWASSRLEGRTSWIFSSCGRCSRLTTGTSVTRSGGLRKGQSPCELLVGLSGFLSRPCRGLKFSVEWLLELEDSAPVLTWILGYFWSLPSGLSKGQSPCEFLGCLSEFLSRRCWGLRPCVESVPVPEDSSPVLTWILGYFWSLPRGVSPRLELGMQVHFPPEL